MDEYINDLFTSLQLQENAKYLHSFGFLGKAIKERLKIMQTAEQIDEWLNYNNPVKETVSRRLKAIELYKEGFSASEIKEKLNINYSVRQIQRWMSAAGIMRTHGESLKLRIARGTVHWNRHPDPNRVKIKRKGLPPGLRATILKRDNYRCVWCGATAQVTRLQVDHIDNNPNHNDDKSNFQTLCEECNKSKYWVFKESQKQKENTTT